MEFTIPYSFTPHVSCCELYDQVKRKADSLKGFFKEILNMMLQIIIILEHNGNIQIYRIVPSHMDPSIYKNSTVKNNTDTILIILVMNSNVFPPVFVGFV